MTIDNNTKHKLKLMRFWLKRDLKPFIRIEPKISHLNVDYFKAKETNKVFDDDLLSQLKGTLSLKEILNLNLSQQDIKEFLKINCPEMALKISKL